MSTSTLADTATAASIEMPVDFSLPAELGDLETALRAFADKDLRPHMRDFEAAGRWPEEVLRTFDGFAVAGLELPEAWEGAGAGALARVLALEAIAGGDAGGLAGADAPGAASAAVACPDTARAAEVTRRCLRREATWALVFGDSSHVAWLPGSARPDWTWITVGRSLRLLDTAGCSTTTQAAGALAASGGIELDLRGAELVGEWELAPQEANVLRGRARLWPAAVSLGVASGALDYAVAYAKERVVMGKPVAHHQGNAFAIAAAAAGIAAARVSVRAAAWRIDARQDGAGVWATLAYLDAMEAALLATDLGVQLLGGHGYIEDHPAEKWFREARTLAGLLGGRSGAVEEVGELVLELKDPLLP